LLFYFSFSQYLHLQPAGLQHIYCVFKAHTGYIRHYIAVQLLSSHHYVFVRIGRELHQPVHIIFRQWCALAYSVQQYLQSIGRTDIGLDIELHKKMPIGSGLGSSSASTVAGLFAIKTLLGDESDASTLLPFAMQGEELACGHGHADNVAPALMGGFVLIRSYEPLDVIRLPHPAGLYCGIIFPDVDVPTREARQIIRKSILMKDAVTQWGNIAGLVSGLFMNDIDLIGRSMKDILVEPVRSMLIPGFYQMREMAMEMGAVSFGISGSGPSVFAFTRDEDTAKRITQKLQAYLTCIKIGSNIYVSTINDKGPRVI